MNLLHLRYICEVAKCGSISKAATKLYVNQPRLSKIIKDVELDMGIKIFERTTQGVLLTKKGNQFIEQAKRIIYEVDYLKNMYGDNHKSLHINMSVPRASYISTAFVNYLNETHLNNHEIKMNYHETNSLETIDHVFNSDVEIGIIRFPMEDKEYYLNMLAFKDLQYQELFRFHYQLLMSKDNPLVFKDIFFDDLQKQIELIHGDVSLPNHPLAFTNHLYERLASSRVINIYERGSQFEILSKLNDSYMWVSPMPQQTLDRFQLVQRECKDMKTECMDMLIYRKGYQFTKENEEFLHQLRETIEGLK